MGGEGAREELSCSEDEAREARRYRRPEQFVRCYSSVWRWETVRALPMTAHCICIYIWGLQEEKGNNGSGAGKDEPGERVHRKKSALHLRGKRGVHEKGLGAEEGSICVDALGSGLGWVGSCRCRACRKDEEVTLKPPLPLRVCEVCASGRWGFWAGPCWVLASMSRKLDKQKEEAK